MFALARTYLDQFGEQGDVYFSLNIHSKTLSSSVLNALVGYHERMRAHYGRAYRAITFQEAASTLSPRKMEPELPATLGGKYGIS